MKRGRLSGWQWLWVVFSMIWIVLASAVKVPELTDSRPVYEWAKLEIDASLHKYDQSPGSGHADASRVPLDGQDEGAKYVSLAGFSARPVAEYVDFVLADRGRQIAHRICAMRSSCPDADKLLAPELEKIRFDLDRQLAEVKIQQLNVLKSGLRLVLIPPLAFLVFGYAVVRIIARAKTGNH
jgi:hypothetical protein